MKLRESFPGAWLLYAHLSTKIALPKNRTGPSLSRQRAHSMLILSSVFIASLLRVGRRKKERQAGHVRCPPEVGLRCAERKVCVNRRTPIATTQDLLRGLHESLSSNCRARHKNTGAALFSNDCQTTNATSEFNQKTVRLGFGGLYTSRKRLICNNLQFARNFGCRRRFL